MNTLTDEEVLARASCESHFLRLWRGETGEYPSSSEADAALCVLLSHHTRDAAQVERIFSHSGLVRPKWLKRADYRRRTVDFALSTNGLTTNLLASAEQTYATASTDGIAAYECDLTFATDVLALIGY